MISELISENEFKRRLALWTLENDRGVFLPSAVTKSEFVENFRLPEFEFTHTQSYADENGDLITLLKSEIRLSAWETKNGKEPRKFVFYKILKTVTDESVLEPKTIGYITA